MKKFWHRIPIHIRKSLILHFAIALMVCIDLPSWFRSKPEIVDVPIIVDLKDVKISGTTNLPSKLKVVEEKKKKEAKIASKAKKKTVEEVNKEVTKKQAEAKSSEPEVKKEEKAEKAKGSFLDDSKKLDKKKEKKKDKKLDKPKKTEKSKEKEAPKLKKGLKSLLASVGEMSRELEKETLDDSKKEEETTDEVTKDEAEDMQNLGVEGGVGGSYFRELTISERDAIAGRLRECWNVDPGARGIEDMVVEARAYLNKDGTVQKVDIIDTSRYNKDPFFRSVAESAKRAVFICAPYSLFAEKYSDKYSLWKTILLNFNPVDGSIK